MTPSALEVYQRGLSAALLCPAADGTSGVGRGYRVHADDGTDHPLPLGRWMGEAAPADELVLDRATGPVLDVGCGPGRHVAALRRRGVPALGLDVAPLAVRIARGRGARVLQRSVFDRVPRRGDWATALLLDGNLGIGGDPIALLRRVGGLLTPGGCVLVEPDPPGRPATAALRARIVGPDGPSQWFRWARVPANRLGQVAQAGGFAVSESWQRDGRWFARLGPIAADARANGREPRPGAGRRRRRSAASHRGARR